MIFNAITLRGIRGSLVHGYRPAASCPTWAISRGTKAGEWALSATVEGVNAFALRQRPLLFTAPRKRGLWCFPVQQLTLTDDARSLRATLGQPEY